MIAEEGKRRYKPRVWDTDWLMLRGLAGALTGELSRGFPAGGKLIDFGCGTMPYRELVETAGLSYEGADFEDTAVRIGADGTLAVPDATADAVLSIQVLEHVGDLDRYLGEARRVLKSDGTLLLSTHGSWLYHPHPGDYRRWTRTGLTLELRQRGFTVDEVASIVGPLATTTMIRLTGYAFFLRRLPLVGVALARLVAVAMNLRGWIEDALTPSDLVRDNGCIYVVRCTKVAA